MSSTFSDVDVAAVSRELLELLKLKHAPKSAASCTRLCELVSNAIATNSDIAARQIAWMLLQVAVRDKEAPQADGTKPLAAAAQLLAFVNYPRKKIKTDSRRNISVPRGDIDIHAVVPGTSHSIDEFRRMGSKKPRGGVDPYRNIGLRQMMAIEAGNYPGGRYVLSGRTKRLPQVARALALSCLGYLEPGSQFVARVNDELTRRAPNTQKSLQMGSNRRNPMAVFRGASRGGVPRSVPIVITGYGETFARKRALSKRGLMIAAATAVVAILAVYSLLVIVGTVGNPFVHEPTATEIRTFFPTSADETQASSMTVVAGFDTTCANTSLASLRRDARLCVIGDIAVADPCFALDQRSVACPSLTVASDPTMKESVLRISNVAEFSFDASQSASLIGAEDAAKQDYPWMIELDDTAKSGNRYICEFAWGDPHFARGQYLCNADLAAQLRVPNDLPTFEKTGSTLIANTAGALYAASLNRESPTWTVQLQDDRGSLKTVDVLAAWF